MREIEDRLRARTRVTDERLDSFAARLRGRLRRRLIIRIAAGLLLPLAAGAALLAAPGEAPVPLSPVLVVARDGDPGPSRYAPPGLGELVRESDAAIVASVRAVDEGRVTLSVREVVYGPPGYGFDAVPEHSRRPHSCSRAMVWTPGEECVLFLWRDPETGGFEVKYGGGGKIDFPWCGVFGKADVREMIRTGSLRPARLAELIGEYGPRALGAARSELWAHPRGRHSQRHQDEAPPTQVALERWLDSEFSPAKVPPDVAPDALQVLSVLRFLAPERLRAQPARIRRALRDAARDHENVYTLLEFLAPMVRARLPEIRDDFHAYLSRLEEMERTTVRDPTQSSWVRLRARAFALEAGYDPESALPKLWAIHDSRKLAGLFDRGDVLELLLPLDPDRAARAIVEFTRNRIAAGYAPRIDLLAKASGPDAAAALEKALLRPDYDAGDVGHREQLREAFLDPGGAPRLARVRETILRRVREVDDDARDLAAWVELLATDGGKIAPVLPRIRAALAREGGRPEDVAELLRVCQRAQGDRWLDFKSPTDAEIEAARAEALRVLGR